MAINASNFKAIVKDKNHLKQEMAQLEYTTTHINNVKKAWEMMKQSQSCMQYIEDLNKNNYIPTMFLTMDALVHMGDILISNHDHSKLCDEEWEPYRKHFYPLNDKEKEESKDEFEKAWEHHYSVNSHHWQYWYYKNVEGADKMALLPVVELCCDWIAMNFVFPGTALDYYNNKVINYKDPDEQIHLGEKQAEVVLELLTRWYDTYPKNN